MKITWTVDMLLKFTVSRVHVIARMQYNVGAILGVQTHVLQCVLHVSEGVSQKFTWLLYVYACSPWRFSANSVCKCC